MSLAALILRNARLLSQARELSRDKSEFLNMAAHELRTPLAVISGYVSLMEDETFEVPETTRREAVVVLRQKTDELAELVENLIAAARLQARSVHVVTDAFDLRDEVTAAVHRAAPRALLRQAELLYRPATAPMVVDADRQTVGRILDNLLNNALSYGRGNPVRVRVDSETDAVVRVEDQGIGVDAEHGARIFEPFYRVQGPLVGREGGTGLGLAISRQLAQLNGGSLSLEWSQPDVGSIFALRLPVLSP